MPVTVKTFATSGEAAAALSSERDARYLGGGTLVMRALNEGDVSIATIVRATDRALTHLDVTSSRITIGAGVTFARVLAERELAFLHPVAGSIGGPATWVRSAATCLRRRRLAISASRCSRSTQPLRYRADMVCATCRSRSSLPRVVDSRAGWCFRFPSSARPARTRFAIARLRASSRRAAP